MNISEISRLVWEHSHSFEFGDAESWSEELFTAAWGKSCERASPWSTYRTGWYWFLARVTLEELRAIARPEKLPKKGCDIGAMAAANWETFGPELLCGARDDGRLVVYNGHENDVHYRVRSHFALDNDGTGALGLQHFPLHHRTWELRIFAAPCLPSVPEEQQARISSLLKVKSGRVAVETAWRARYGWPVLCKA